MAIYLSIPVGAYNVREGYIEYMREYDPSILPPEVTNTYYGPILTKVYENQPISIFAPLLRGNSDELPTMRTLFDEVDIVHAIPCDEYVLSDCEYDPERVMFFIENHETLSNAMLKLKVHA